MNLQKTILGCILIDYSIHDVVIPELRVEYFSGEWRFLFDLMSRMYSKNIPIDTVSVVQRLKDAPLTPLDIAQLTDNIASTKNIMQYISDLKNSYLRDQVKYIVGAELDFNDDPYEYLSGHIGKLEGLLNNTTTSDEIGIIDLCHNVMTMPEPESYNIGLLDRFNIFSANRLIALGGRPSHGKTSFALGITRAMCEHKKKVLFFSLEMTADQLVRRITIDGNYDRTSKYDLHILEKSSIDTEYIRRHCRLLKPEFVVIDYLGMMKLPKGERRTYQIGDITKELKSICKELNIPMMVLVQASRRIEERPIKKYDLGDYADSADIERDIDVGLFIARMYLWGVEEYMNGTPTRGTVSVQFVKNRYGDVGDEVITTDSTIKLFGNEVRYEDPF